MAMPKTKRRRTWSDAAPTAKVSELFLRRLTGPTSALTDAEFVSQIRASAIKGEATPGLLARLESRIKT